MKLAGSFHAWTLKGKHGNSERRRNYEGNARQSLGCRQVLEDDGRCWQGKQIRKKAIQKKKYVR